MTLFDIKCPMCGSLEWQSIEKDENGINLLIECLQCRTIRGRKQEPIESTWEEVLALAKAEKEQK